MNCEEEKNRIREIFRAALVSGDVIRAPSCEFCEKMGYTHGHHWLYDDIHALDVIWLCKSCHSKLHTKEKHIANRAYYTKRPEGIPLFLSAKIYESDIKERLSKLMEDRDITKYALVRNAVLFYLFSCEGGYL